MRDLVSRRRVRLVYPIPRDLWIVKLPDRPDATLTRRKSPRHLGAIDLFRELVSFPELATHENFELDVVLTEEEVVWRHVPGKRWRRRGWVTVERRLLNVYETVALRHSGDYLGLIPVGLPKAFGTADLATAIKRPRRIAQQVAYCLRNGGLIEKTGAQGKAIMYARVVT